MTDNQRRVLVVEDRAHRALGHFPSLFAEVAIGLAENGCSVEVLTSNGWLFDGQQPVPFVVRRYGLVDRWCFRFGEAFVTTRGLRGLARRARTRALVHAARARCRAAGTPQPDVVVVSTRIDTLSAVAHAGDGRWLFHSMFPPRGSSRAVRRAERAERRRREAGGRARVATHDGEIRDAWAETATFVEPVRLPIAGVRTARPVPNARLRLGLSADDNVALLFGTAHGDKDVDLVSRVFDDLADWLLLVAGRVRDDFVQRHAGAGPDAFVLGGFVDNATRDVVYSAADLVVLSFDRGFRRDSGVLMDAISFAVPVVCSDDSGPADLVREYHLGVVFEPGDFDSLERAIATAPSQIEPTDLARAQSELSNRAVARRLLDALEGN
jgi:glycosyltransferase involved in cell wall biosynthesis